MVMRVAVVGLGRWAEAHVAAARRTEAVDVVACFTRTPERRKRFGAANDIAWVAPSYEALLDSDHVDAVVLSTPNDVHVEMAEAALAAGKAVLVDKPVAVGVGEGLALLRALRPGNLITVAHHARRLAGHRAQARWLDSAGSGEVRLAAATFSNNRGAAMAAEAWHRRVRGSEAGVLIQVGIHHIDNVLHLLGPAESVNARFGYGALGPRMPSDAAVVIAHTSGAISTVTSSWTTPSQYRLDIQATGGRIEFWQDHRHWTSPEVDRHGETWLWPLDGERRPIEPVPGDPLADQLADLAAARSGDRSAGVSVIEGLRAVLVVEAAVQSAALGGAAVDVETVLRAAGATSAEVGALLSAS